VEQVRCRVVLAGELAHRIDLELRRLPRLDATLDDLTEVDDGVANLHGVRHFKHAGWRGDRAHVADLAAGLRVEAGLIDEQTDGLSLGECARLKELVVLDPAEDLAIALEAGPLGAVGGFWQSTADIERHLMGNALSARDVLVPLLEPIERLFVYAQSLLS